MRRSNFEIDQNGLLSIFRIMNSLNTLLSIMNTFFRDFSAGSVDISNSCKNIELKNTMKMK